MSLPDRILAIVAKSTPQAPMCGADIIAALGAGHIDARRALDSAVAAMLLNTARITRNGLTHDVYWPTGRKTPVLTGNKKEPLAVPKPTEPDTHGSRLIKLIIAHGPIIAADLAEKAGVVAKNIDPYLASAVKHGQIHTRMGYVPELGRERKHYMTATQAQEWDDRGQQIEVGPVEETANAAAQGGHAMSHPATLERLAVLEREHKEFFDNNWHDQRRRAEAQATQIHDLKNDIAARDLILNNLADTLKVQQIEDIPGALDDLTHALATRAMAANEAAGKPALLLIDSSDLTEVEMLTEDDDAQRIALHSIELGHAARVLVVRILGEAQRTAVWKEAT